MTGRHLPLLLLAVSVSTPVAAQRTSGLDCEALVASAVCPHALGEDLRREGHDPTFGSEELLRPPRPGSRSPRREDDRRGYRNDFRLSFESLELGEIESDVEDQFGNVVGETDIADVNRDILELRYRGGPEGIGFHVGVFAEADFLDSYDLLGLRVGLSGTPRLASATVAPVIDYELSVGFRGGDGDVGASSRDIAYGEIATRLGGGVDIRGFQAVAGLATSSIFGAVENQLDDAVDFWGVNAGGFVSGRYAGVDVPLVFSITGYFGDLAGVAVAAGVRF